MMAEITRINIVGDFDITIEVNDDDNDVIIITQDTDGDQIWIGREQAEELARALCEVGSKC